MFRVTGIDEASSGRREVTAGLFGQPESGPGGRSRVYALPSPDLTFRRLNLPNTNNKEMRRSVIQEELNFSLPFRLNQAAWDYTESGNEAWVVVASADSLDKAHQAEPGAQFDVEPLCYLRAARQQGVNNALVIDLGASKTVFCGIEDSRVESVRVLLRGGDQLTRRLAESGGGDLQQAEHRKRSQGMDLRECGLFFEELLEQAMLDEPLPYDRVLLAGGGSSMPGLSEWLQRRLGVGVELFPLPGELSAERHLVAYGAALAGRPGAVRVKLRKQEVRVGGKLPMMTLLGLLLLALFVVADLEVRHRTLQKKRDQMVEILAGGAQVPVPADGMLNSGELLERIKKQISFQQQVLAAAPGPFMKALGKSSIILDRNPDAEVRNFEFVEGLVRVEGLAASLEQMESIKNELAKVLEGVELKKNRPADNDRFRFVLEGRPPRR